MYALELTETVKDKANNVILPAKITDSQLFANCQQAIKYVDSLIEAGNKMLADGLLTSVSHNNWHQIALHGKIHYTRSFAFYTEDKTFEKSINIFQW